VADYTNDIFRLLRFSLPDERIFEDIRNILDEGDRRIELDGQWVPYEPDVPLQVLVRSVYAYEMEFGFGNGFRVLVAIGGVKGIEAGVPRAGICFATLWYRADRKLITVDFTADVP
jgi:hypothetical protein